MKTIEELKSSIVNINYIIENIIGEAKVGKSAMAQQKSKFSCEWYFFSRLKIK